MSVFIHADCVVDEFLLVFMVLRVSHIVLVSIVFQRLPLFSNLFVIELVFHSSSMCSQVIIVFHSCLVCSLGLRSFVFTIV